ncbi:MAG TPA: elongation factor G [Baekduia sp.]|uniref:elongation factor G n=1 Tax=Baekduia sp. TaxID=2600305 RepID=UPI002D7858FD|nr:elongation factor G [Baekduia sp.]HET6507522.1 elongation factor G [Baekduia sp.]
MHKAADRIRNVALVGHRGAGKTSLHEAPLFQAGVLNRLGSVTDGTTVSDADPDEKARQMSISLALSSFEWQERKVNLLDTPGDASFIADALGALRVCESAVFVINAVMGVEVHANRLWQRAAELDLARLVFVNMLDRERADFFRTLDSLKSAFGQHVVATEIPIGSEHEVSGVIDLVDMKAYEYSEQPARDGCREIPIPDAEAQRAQEYREKLMDEVSETSDALMERYLEGEAISHEEIVAALKEGTNHGSLFPVTCGVATRNLATNRLLDAIVEDLPSPVKHGGLEVGEVTLHPDEDAELFAYVFKTRADPFAGRINLFRVYQGTMSPDTQALNTRTHNKERIGQLVGFSGAETTHPDEFGPGDIGAVAKLKETRAGDWLAARDEPIRMPSIALPAPVMAFAIAGVGGGSAGDEDKVFTALRRLQEEDPTIDLHRDPQTGEQIVAGLSQVHVEVIVERLRARFGAEVSLKPPRVPYQETIRGSARAHGRHKKQSGGRGQFGDCHIAIEPLAAEPEGFEFVNEIKGGVIPSGFIPAVEKGVQEAMQQGVVAGFPVKGVRVRVYDGSYHTVDSSEMAFKVAGSQAMRQALQEASPVLLEPMMLATINVPEDAVGDVIGDLNSRRGRPLGMEPAGAGMTEIKAEVPMAEMLSYAPDLRALTGGQGEFAMEFQRYEEVPAHLASKVVSEARAEQEAVQA